MPGPLAYKSQWKMAKPEQGLNTTLSEFEVRNCSIELREGNVRLEFVLQRLNSSFWLSVFIPSICLILAAEITLFINETHFKTTVMVSLTANLVMYTLYSAIQRKLPEDSNTLKLIDVWLVHGLIMPMVVFIVLVTNELINSETTAKVSNFIHKVSDLKSETENHKSEAWVSQKSDDNLKKKKNRSFIQTCQMVVPSTSVIFILTFFAIGYNVSS